MNQGVEQKRALLIAGPTASGKSGLAGRLAERLGGVIVNADSMQVYRDLRVLTARPSIEEESRIPHRLYGHIDAAENYSVGQWIRDVGLALSEIWRAGALPIVVGGTGLYFKALLRGLAEVPPTPPDVRAQVRERFEKHGVAALYRELEARDAQGAARLKPNDTLRITRALEVLDATGRPLREWHRSGMPALITPNQASAVFLAPDRGALYQAIDARFDAMVQNGALDEIERLALRKLDPMLPAMRAHGVPWLLRHLRGEVTLAEAIQSGKADTRHYAKRQFTWFRHQLREFQWAPPADAFDAITNCYFTRENKS